MAIRTLTSIIDKKDLYGHSNARKNIFRLGKKNKNMKNSATTQELKTFCIKMLSFIMEKERG